MSRLFTLFFIFGFSIFCSLDAQVVYQDINKTSVYNYLDEMANLHKINTNPVIKPYSRQFIAEKLAELDTQRIHLNKRQTAELDFYLMDFNKELKGSFENKRFDVFYYSDSLFTFSLNGILGGQGWKNENGFNYHRWYGAEAFAYAGEHLGVYASLRDNTEKVRLADTGLISLRNGSKYRRGDYSEMRGGITYAWNWGHVALVKDYVHWGSSYRYPNIIGSKAPSFAQLKWNIKPADWFEFNYIHGWLVSEIVDSARSYTYNGVQRNVFHNKFIAANMFTFMPWKRLNLSVGNSVIYSDQVLNPAYFIPVFFYKSVDHTYNGNTNAAGQNSQMFFNISSRLIPKVHMYYSMFIDVMSFSSLFSEEEHANHWSMQGGVKVSNLLPNIALTVEYIRNNALVYKNDKHLLYSSNQYSLGHYLGDNAREIYIGLEFKPMKNLHFTSYFSMEQKGPDYPYTRSTGDVWGIPFMESIEWEQNQIGIQFNYQILNDFFVFLEAEKRNVNRSRDIIARQPDYDRYCSEFYQGDTFTWSFGINCGF
ncbi:MAG: hypothetical protein JXP36_03650 [Bacteroidales bacterium]|nr:hypothetical protein [Bacteroidales bacterium]